MQENKCADETSQCWEEQSIHTSATIEKSPKQLRQEVWQGLKTPERNASTSNHRQASREILAVHQIGQILANYVLHGLYKKCRASFSH
eukprot:1161942-Pelagomonas_calceolata.AAC.1